MTYKVKQVSIAYDRDKYGNTIFHQRYFVERLEGLCLVDYGNYDSYGEAEKRIKILIGKE